MKWDCNPFLLTLSLMTMVGIEAYSNVEHQFVELRTQALSQKLSYLPTFLEEKQKTCQMFTNAEHKNCLSHAIKHAEEILNCPRSPLRFQQGIEYDDRLAKETFLQNQKSEIPKALKLSFTKMIQNIESLIEFRLPIKFSLEAYESPARNAHAAIDGKIYVSSGLWKTEPALSESEVIAVMAHEIAHVIKGHGAQLNCMALEWTSYEMSIPFAQATFKEEFQGSDRFNIWSQFSQKLELEADQVATQILKKSGFNPNLMAQALIKLKPKVQGGFSSGSHPDFENRVKLAQQASDGL
jgi:hypothetical protein